MSDPSLARRTAAAMSRRRFLRVSAIATGAVPTAAALLEACTRSPEPAKPRPSQVVVGSGHATAPTTLPISEANPPIDSGLPIEKDATIRIYEWREYLSRKVLDGFATKYGARVEVSSFDNREKGLSAIQNGAVFDVFFPTVDQLAGLAAARLLQPLNPDYLPNARHLWPQFSAPIGPYYDAGLHYSVPYTVFSTGIGWRSDLVAGRDSPPALDDPYGIYWNPRYRGSVGLYDDYREVLATALLREGIADVNTGNASLLARAGSGVAQLRARVHATFDAEGAYEGLPRGEFAIHQAWSGDILSARRFGRSDALGTTNLLRYFWPTDGRGVIGADLIAIPANAPSPVLAHAFLNHLLDPKVALANFAWNGYQPPVDGTAPEAFSNRRSPLSGLVPPNLRSAILSPEDVQRALVLRPLTPTAQGLWLKEWQAMAPGASSSI